MANNYMGTKAGLNNIKAVMGWDICYGRAFIKQIVGGRQFAESLYIHQSRDQQVFSSVLERERPFVPPEDWNYKYHAGLTYRQYMSNCIRGVSEAILQNSSNLTILKENNIVTKDGHWKKDEVLLVVSYPDTGGFGWEEEKMRKQFDKLISEATGISNVILMEGSLGRVFSRYEIDNICTKIDWQTGVLVLDFGSSTADATYILPGKKAFNLSWELGAAQVENAMLEYILQSSKAKEELAWLEKRYDKKRVLVVRNECSHAFFDLRLNKEDYFDGKLGENAEPKAVFIPIMDEDGDQIFDEDGEPALAGIRYYVTDEMMQYALDGYEFDVKKNDQIVNRGTWKENCWLFLNDVKQTLEREELQVNTVFVIGEGSQMPFIVELSDNAFHGEVMRSDMLSHSAVRVLVTIAYKSGNKVDFWARFPKGL